ncbi:SRPBCC family protein [Cerasicoccus arenae]|uniref:Vanillate O-demethylase oxidoreductase VanB n=1 Tax=Cerasicoccus arenae TaxID=424488 RepID=A0A8J3DI10_9BACT|nr:SRPBCC family protein [Cerasicoccus arenae]MBK1859573.1 SRPBCC family protein [Cerasicoccus arenae]GHC03025.1 vanillate O-demethylase oxidoreductase VanB [Cerasicoccus arenae]
MKHTIIKQIEIAAPVSKVWRALTDHRQFGEWFHAKIDSPFVVGGTSTGSVNCSGCESHEWKVIIEKMEPETYFAYRWHPFGVDDKRDFAQGRATLVEFRLTPIATGTLLQVTESGFEHLPDDRRDEAFRMNTGGWEMQLENIARYAAENR